MLPRARDGETGVVDYDGSWNISALAEAARRLAGPYAPAIPQEKLSTLASQTEQLRDVLFELMFMAGTHRAEQSKGNSSKPWYSRFFSSSAPRNVEKNAPSFDDIETSLDLSGDTACAIRSCEAALSRLRGE